MNKKILLSCICLILLWQHKLLSQIKTSEVVIEHTSDITSINGNTNINGLTTSNGLRIPSRFTFGQSQAAIEIEVPDASYNAIRAFQGTKNLGTLHFFDDNWSSGSPSGSAGATNLSGLNAVTIGQWNNPAAYFRNSDGFVGIGTENPSHLLSVKGVTYTEGIRIPGLYSFGTHNTGAMEIEIATDNYNAIRGYNGDQHIGTIHFFDDTWGAASPQNSAGSINLDALTAVTIGPWNNPTAYFRASDGFVGIGTETPQAELHVNGTIKALATDWPDFVFYENYVLPELKEVEEHINRFGHLKDIPSAAQVKQEDLDLAQIDAKLLRKIEELTLYLIDQNKEIQELKKEVSYLKKRK